MSKYGLSMTCRGAVVSGLSEQRNQVNQLGFHNLQGCRQGKHRSRSAAVFGAVEWAKSKSRRSSKNIGNDNPCSEHQDQTSSTVKNRPRLNGSFSFFIPKVGTFRCSKDRNTGVMNTLSFFRKVILNC